ncbi:hypothetical protein C0992_002356 [Termitomyces sp. T32_za158]|nr:hypothetical protein C0992_002356 [Termitomyces sp. T32_za158]
MRDTQYDLFRCGITGVRSNTASPAKLLDARFRILMAYRLLDVYIMVKGLSVREPVDRLNDQPLMESRKAYRFASQKGLTSYLQKNVDVHMNGDECDSPLRSSSHLVRLYASLARRVSERNVYNTLINLTSASIHIGCLLKGNLALPVDTATLEALLLSECNADADQLELVKLHASHGSTSRGRTNSLHNTLYLALAVSPLLLLLPREYNEIGGKELMLSIWNHVGGLRRPPCIVEAEHALWNVLFSTALGADLVPSLQSALHALNRYNSDTSSAWISLVDPMKEAAPSLDGLSGTDRPFLTEVVDSGCLSNVANSPSLNDQYNAPSVGLQPSLRDTEPVVDASDSNIYPSSLVLRRSARVTSKDVHSVDAQQFNRSKNMPIIKKKHRAHYNRKPASARPRQLEDRDFRELDIEQSDDENTEEPLDLSVKAQLVYGDTEVVYDLAVDLDWFYSLDEAVNASKSRPSAIKIIEYTNYRTMGTSHILSLLRIYACILIINEPHSDAGFSKTTLSEVCRLGSVTTLHDFAFFSENRTRRGSPVDLFRALDVVPPRSISALNLPASDDEFPKLPFASEKFAWSEVRGRSYCDANEQYPVSDMRWALASTGSSHHYWHIDSNGLGTFVKVETGTKFWYIARPKSGDFTEFRDFSIYANDFDFTNANYDRWDVELIVFGPGSTLDLSHIPDVNTWSGLLDLLTFCNYFDLYCATVNWTFCSQTDGSNSRDEVRSFELAIRNRSRARSIVQWFFRTHDLEDPLGNVFAGSNALSSVYNRYLAIQAHDLMTVVESARFQEFKSDFDHLHPKYVRAAINDCILGGPAWTSYKTMERSEKARTFLWDGPTYKIVGGKNNIFGALKCQMPFELHQLIEW